MFGKKDRKYWRKKSLEATKLEEWNNLTNKEKGIIYDIMRIHYFFNCSEGLRTNLYTLSIHFAMCIYYRIVYLTSVQSVKYV